MILFHEDPRLALVRQPWAGGRCPVGAFNPETRVSDHAPTPAAVASRRREHWSTPRSFARPPCCRSRREETLANAERGMRNADWKFEPRYLVSHESQSVGAAFSQRPATSPLRCLTDAQRLDTTRVAAPNSSTAEGHVGVAARCTSTFSPRTSVAPGDVIVVLADACVAKDDSRLGVSQIGTNIGHFNSEIGRRSSGTRRRNRKIESSNTGSG